MLSILPEIGPNLFWVSTPDRQGNWFVIARTARAATRFFVEHEGYIARAAKAEIVTSVPFLPETGEWTIPVLRPDRRLEEGCRH